MNSLKALALGLPRVVWLALAHFGTGEVTVSSTGHFSSLALFSTQSYSDQL